MDLIKKELDLCLINSIKNDIKLKQNLKTTISTSLYIIRSQNLVWNLLHSFSVFYPEIPSDNFKNNTKEFIKNFKRTLPFCSSCNNNKNDVFIENYDLDIAVSSRSELILFFIKYHSFINENLINKSNYNSSIYTNDYVINKYQDGLFNEYFINNYQIDLYKIINENFNFDNLRNLMLRFRNQISSEINILNYDLDFSIIIK